MKWKKKSITCRLLAGLTALMFSACNHQPSLRLISSKVLDFPAASGLEFYKDTLYVFGDNAPYLLLLSPDYQSIRRYTYWPGNDTVISKDEKPDIESAMIVLKNNRPVLVGMGSMSAEKRWTMFELPIGADTVTRSQVFEQGTTFSGIEEINIEGSTAFGNQVLFCSRANLKTRKNHLLFRGDDDSVVVKEISLPKTNWVAGLSGLYYVLAADLLLFTASEEATTNAYEDGAIGESYLGWISKFSEVAKKEVVTPDGFLKLSSFDKAFSGQKIESVCVEKQSGNYYRLHLAADNDNSKSVLFKVDLKL